MSKNGEDGFLSRYRLIIVFIVYSTLVLDNILLTVVGKLLNLHPFLKMIRNLKYLNVKLKLYSIIRYSKLISSADHARISSSKCS